MAACKQSGTEREACGKMEAKLKLMWFYSAIFNHADAFEC